MQPPHPKPMPPQKKKGDVNLLQAVQAIIGLNHIGLTWSHGYGGSELHLLGNLSSNG